MEMNSYSGKPIPTEQFEFRVSPKIIPKKKKFQLDIGTSKPTGTRPSKLQRKLNKRKRNALKTSDTRKLFHNQLDWPSGVKGNTIDESSYVQRQKIKYHNTFSCSQTSLFSYASSQMQDITSLARGITDLHLKKDQKEMFSSARSISSYIEFVAPHPSLVSEKSSFLSGYDDEFFDILDLPGHFNTKGIYGQRVNPPNLTLSRARSDLQLDKIRPLQKETRRQNTLLLTPIRTNLKLEHTQRKSEKDLVFPTLQKSKLTTHSTFLDTPMREKTTVSERSFKSEKSMLKEAEKDKPPLKERTQHMQKEQRDRRKTEHALKPEKELTKLSDTMDKYEVKVEKDRTSVDVMTQTDNDIAGFDIDQPIIDYLFT